ncbi:MAG TPA: 50S ribosomal protein L29 [Cryomorphaceae bacterium]|nr:50S ribosomal protein L29 [Cryomorphaceae bacterium]
MKAKDIRDLTTDELIEKLEIEEENFGKLRLNHTVAALENPMQLRAQRRTVARLKTVVRERQLSEKK